MSGSDAPGTCAPCPPCEKRQRTATLLVTKVKRYPNGRHCAELNTEGACRCKRWHAGKGGASVATMCERAGREFKIGNRVLKART